MRKKYDGGGSALRILSLTNTRYLEQLISGFCNVFLLSVFVSLCGMAPRSSEITALRIDFCDARPFCSALLKIGYLF